MVAVGFYSYFSTVLFLLLVVTISHCLGLKCKEHQHPFSGKCCKDCAPGERMRSRCTATTDTVCAPCQDEYFSSEHNHNFCKSCTICNTRKGSMEVKKCEKTSDRICMCVAGYMPDVRYTLGSECSPCPEGSYSIGGNENCRPWTNCSLLGKNTLRPGTKTDDAVCSNHVTQPPASQSATPAVNLSTTDHKNNKSTAVFSPSRPSVIPFICPDTNSPTDTNWGSLSLILICLILLVVSGMSILLLIIQAAKKETKKRPCRNNHQNDSTCPSIEDHDCKCRQGYSCIDSACLYCKKLPECAEGEELVKIGIFDFTFKCKPCEIGTYSNVKNGWCRNWTDCESSGFLTIKQGNSTHNAVCGFPAKGLEQAPTTNYSPYTTILAILTAAAVFVLILLTFFLHLCIWSLKKEKYHTADYLEHNFPRLPVAPQLSHHREETYSCQFPEEEHGDKTPEEKLAISTLRVYNENR
ncbi:LOW QUALITY PROTEIN: tumor necrosis factor receptor superfamily member 4-like [Harpia harpyja]|uniref:LOW QUALITY PROTEIN: tumor necrosis factor receptor superfamily member 4-like n=1 Tax=Harpia harpyja TaxID=202280 RepID=UPI0022B0E14A|nr:LOW QUALITY PROTEIN: tumor necrosis factor receptor superfamily member 4-like [Harpia harpyja]